VPVLMFTCLGLGVLIILANYVGLMPGGDANNWYLLVGLALITAGFLTATQYR
jgi:LPXTG-motif cell wall-anchored protein